MHGHFDHDKPRRGIEFLKMYYQSASRIVLAWSKLNRGTLFLFCTNPTSAADNFDNFNANNRSGKMKLKKSTVDEFKEEYGKALKGIRTAFGAFSQVIKFTFKTFGGETCKPVAEKLLKALRKIKLCPKADNAEEDDCKAFLENLKVRPLAFRAYFGKWFIGKADPNNADNEGTDLNANADGNNVPVESGSNRILETEPAEGEDIAEVQDNDPNGVGAVSDPDFDNSVNFGGINANGECSGNDCGNFQNYEGTDEFNDDG